MCGAERLSIDGSFLIEAFRTLPRARERFERGERWYRFSDHFWGTQAVVYPTELLEDLAVYLYENNIRTFKEPVDLLIGRFARNRGVPTIATTPSLVNHIGEETTGQSDMFHTADFFLESVEGCI